MKLEEATRTWLIASSVAAIAIFASGILRAAGKLGPGTLFVVFAISMVVLLYLALKLANARPRLNLTLAAETLVALGIFSLIISIAVVMFSASEFMLEIAKRDLSMEDMRRFAWPFGEGLMAAAVAPFIATLLRHIESNVSSADSGDASFADAAREAEALTDEIKRTVANLKAINAQLIGTKDAFEGALSGAVKATSAFAAILQTETDRLKLSLQRVQAEATGLADASEKSRVRVSELGGSFGELVTSSREAKEMLDALGKLIESVERYIKPGAKHP